MSFYDFNIVLHIERFVKNELLQPIQKAWIVTIAKPLSLLHSILLLRFWDGDNSAKYNNANAYLVGNTVRFRNKIYLCVKDAAIGVTPTNTLYWVKMLDSWIGLKERLHYNGQVIILEFLLNRWFEFDPQLIYIENLDTSVGTFVIGETELESGDIGYSETTTTSYITEDFTDVLKDNFVVNYPSSITIGSTEYLELVALTYKYKLYGTSPIFNPY